MKYCEKTTLSHEKSNIPNAIQILKNILLKESDNRVITNYENKVLDLEFLNKQQLNEKQEYNRTMDFSFGIINSENFEMAMFELKLNVVNPNNLIKEHLVEKVSGSLIALGESQKIHGKYYFIFNDNKYEEAKSRFTRFLPQIPTQYVVMKLSELYNIL